MKRTFLARSHDSSVAIETANSNEHVRAMLEERGSALRADPQNSGARRKKQREKQEQQLQKPSPQRPHAYEARASALTSLFVVLVAPTSVASAKSHARVTRHVSATSTQGQIAPRRPG